MKLLKRSADNFFCSLIFATHSISYMSNEIKENEKDFTKNWVNSSRFLFYLQVFVAIAFIFGSCYNLYEHRYKGKPDVKVPDNTLYTPKYK